MRHQFSSPGVNFQRSLAAASFILFISPLPLSIGFADLLSRALSQGAIHLHEMSSKVSPSI